MKIPIAIISGIIVPLAVGNTACMSTGAVEDPPPNAHVVDTETTVTTRGFGATSAGVPTIKYESTTTRTRVITYDTDENGNPKPKPGANEVKVEGSDVKVNGSTQVETNESTTLNGTVSSDSSMVTGSSEIDGQTWTATVGLQGDYSGGLPLYDVHLGY